MLDLREIDEVDPRNHPLAKWVLGTGALLILFLSQSIVIWFVGLVILVAYFHD